MFQRTILGALAIAAGVAAGLLIKQLKDETEEAPEEKEEEEEVHFIKIEDPDEPEVSKEAQEVLAVYPFLKGEFVQELLNCNESLNEKYPEDTLVTVSHHAEFDNHEEMLSFIDIMDTNGYACKADGQKITASRKFFTQPGAIISDVLNVANQAAALNGVYIDYEISE
jgi:hypothetical protein